MECHPAAGGFAPSQEALRLRIQGQNPARRIHRADAQRKRLEQRLGGGDLYQLVWSIGSAMNMH
jgi:hypothetical protein